MAASDPTGSGAHDDDERSPIPLASRGEIRAAPGSDGQTLRYRFWPATSPAASAVYLHGIAGHSLWFSAAASRLAEAGISVYGPDRRGSGLNTDLGAGHLADYRLVLRDAEAFVRQARGERPDRPVFLLAGCWGAKAGAVFAARAGDLIDGLALIAPALSVRVTLPPRDLIGVALSLLASPRRHFQIPLRPEQYTDNPTFRAFIADDPRRLLTATARFFFETARLDRLAAKAAPAIGVPTIVQCGERDQIVNQAGLRAWYARLGAADKQFVSYPEFAHILEFEAGRETYLRDLLGWLQARLAPVPRRTPAAQGS
jgi:alpha-beta hydrolase superfamily lysophospholipase